MGGVTISCPHATPRRRLPEAPSRPRSPATLSVVSTITLVVAAASMVFSGIQTRHAAMQVRHANEAVSLSGHAAELSFNLEVMARLQDVLFAIADDSASHDLVWGAADTENRRPGVAAQSMLDVLSMALAAMDRLPSPSQDRTDWSSYTKYVLRNSPVVLDQVLQHCEWWPEVVPYANELAPPHRRCPAP